MAHVWLRTSTYGAALTGDSIVYLSVAESLAAGEGMHTFDGGDSALWPPLFPMLMAFASLFGLSLEQAGRFANILAFGLILLVSGLWLQRRLQSRFLAAAGAVSMTASLALNHVATSLLTEALFILFALLALMRLESFLNRDGGWPALLLSAIFAALAAVTRYMGLALILTGVIMLLAHRRPPALARLKHAVAWGACACAPLALVLVRNQAVSGTLAGSRHNASGQPLLDSLAQAVEVFRLGILPAAPAWSGYLLLALAILAASGVALVRLMARAAPETAPDATPDAAPDAIPDAAPDAIPDAIPDAGPDSAPDGAQAKPRLGGGQSFLAKTDLEVLRVHQAKPRFGGGQSFGLFALLHLGILVIIASATVTQPVDARYLAPIYAPLLIAAALLLDRLLRIEASGKAALVKRALAGLLLAGWLTMVGFDALNNVRLTAHALESGYRGYNAAQWRERETVVHARANPIAGQAFSNEPEALYLYTGASPVGKVPLASIIHGCEAWLQSIAAPAYIVWFDERAPPPSLKKVLGWPAKPAPTKPKRCNIREMQPHPALEPLADLPDGAVYRVTSASRGR